LLRCQIPEILVGEGVAYPSQVHDGRHHVPEPGTDPLVHRRRRGGDEADRRADGGWSGDLVPDGADRLSGALRAVEIPRGSWGVGVSIFDTRALEFTYADAC
jgi:hypothetical protein